MNKSFILKILGMLGLVVLMSIAVAYVNDVILERMRNQRHVETDIARSSVRQQTLIGPMLAVPYTEEYIDYVDEITPKGATIQKPVNKRRHATAYFLPEEIQLDGNFTNEYKKRGIYKALMYQLGGTMKGSFTVPASFNVKPKHKNGTLHFEPAYISFGMSDNRGIGGKPQFTFNQQAYAFEPSTRIAALGNGIHAQLGMLNADQTQTHTFTLNLNLRGMKTFRFTPIAENNTIQLRSAWQHPSFQGSFLPVRKEIDSSGFQGQWAVSSLSSTNQNRLIEALDSEKQNPPALESLSIDFIEPINVYSQADRATKYGLLFIGLTFAGFFMFEVIKQLRIHPAQYTFVGLAMTMFYLLLVSFAEIIGFASAYLIASTACVLLLGYYLSFVLKSKANGFLFALLLTMLYGALYGILASEDNALIMGSLLVFGLLATTMVITRKVDWYALGSPKPTETLETI